MTQSHRLVFMGSDPIALPLLDALLAQSERPVELVAVFTQPDRRRGRGMKLAPNPIKEWAQRHAIPVHQPERCGKADAAWLESAKVDLALVMAYGQILPKAVLAAPRLGMVNFHASLLPKLRGASPIHTAVATGEAQTGVSLMRIVPRMDAGPVLDQEAFAIEPDAQIGTVIEQMAAACVPLMLSSLPKILDDEATFAEQNEAAATYCRKITREDAQLDFFQPAQRLHDHIRAFQPWPGADLDIESEILKIRQAQPAPAIGGTPGTLVVDGDQVFIQCGEDALELLELQRTGGKVLPTAEFLRGYGLPSGLQARSYPMPDLVRTSQRVGA